MFFCPECGNFIDIVCGDNSKMSFSCDSCPYIYALTRKVSVKTYPPLKKVDDILGGAEAWKNVDSIEERCPKCQHPRAYFMQIQTRSADEPMTTFYRCCNHDCCHQWRD